MLRTLRDRNLLVPTLMTLAGLAVLVSLGVWQLQRKQWKDGLIADIQRGLSETPAPLDDPPGLWRVLGQREYHPVTAKGVFRHADERHLFAVEQGVAGWHVYTPLDMANGLTVIVNRGFVTEAFKDPATRKAGEIAGEVTLTGLVRQPGKAHLVYAGRGSGAQHLVLARPRRHGRIDGPGRSTASGLAVLHRCQGGAAQSRRLAQGRHHAPRNPEPALGIRHHLVRPRCGAFGRFCCVCLAEAKVRRISLWRCLSRRKHHIRLG